MNLCPTCRHVRRVETNRGSVFLMCGRHRAEPERYPKYPILPVRECAGYEEESA